MAENERLTKSAMGMTPTNKGRAMRIPQNVLEFLNVITAPPTLKHTASHADFIRSAVLQEIRDKIIRCDQKGSY